MAPPRSLLPGAEAVGAVQNQALFPAETVAPAVASSPLLAEALQPVGAVAGEARNQRAAPEAPGQPLPAPTEPLARRERVGPVVPTSWELLVAAGVAGATLAAAAVVVEIQAPQAVAVVGAARRSRRPARRVSCMTQESKAATVR